MEAFTLPAGFGDHKSELGSFFWNERTFESRVKALASLESVRGERPLIWQQDGPTASLEVPRRSMKAKIKDSINFNLDKHWLSSTFFFRITFNFPSFMKLMNTKTGQCVCFSWTRWDSCCHFCCPFWSLHTWKSLPDLVRDCACVVHASLGFWDIVMDPDGLDLDPGFFYLEDAWILGGPPYQ